MTTSNTALIARIVSELIELLDRAHATREAAWFGDRLAAIQSPGGPDEWAEMKAQLRSRTRGMGSLTDLILRPPPDSGLDKDEANDRLSELTNALYELTK